MEHQCNLSVENCPVCTAAEHDPGPTLMCSDCAKGKHNVCGGHLCDCCG